VVRVLAHLALLNLVLVLFGEALHLLLGNSPPEGRLTTVVGAEQTVDPEGRLTTLVGAEQTVEAVPL
jgi:hypothetical protein